ncbi:response regulator [Emticicia sp. CRIBPO]|uniref:response regulator n=1 Tax=Emticicia sp. CRIBPO TaxID=2683258 RepID=UPI001412F2E9|nr:response regulator [Emticicia sp. CRIBPO]NBA89065.1 response regulator [Emticicia sp. CRIBPO]
MNKELLLVDDDEMMLFLHERIVKKCNISAPIRSFRNGKEVLDYLLEDGGEGNIYLILLDINMPVMSGWDFMEELNKQKSKNRILVVIISSSLDIEDLERSQQYAQVIDYLEKPIKSELMLRLMKHEKLRDFI